MDEKDNFSLGNTIPFEERLAIFSKQNIFTAYRQTEDITPILTNLKTNKFVLGKIVKKVTGGFLVKFSRHEGFLPNTQFSKFSFAYSNSSNFIDSYYEFEIIKISSDPFLIILSRRTLQRDPNEEIERKEILIETISKYIELNAKEIVNSRDDAVKILESAEEFYYNKLFEQLSKDDFTLLSEKEDILTDRTTSNYKENEEFCDACQQSPCMCSDPERTSTVGY